MKLMKARSVWSCIVDRLVPMYTCDNKQFDMIDMKNDSGVHRSLFDAIMMTAASQYRYHNSWVVDDRRQALDKLTACYDANGVKDMHVKYVSDSSQLRVPSLGKLFTPRHIVCSDALWLGRCHCGK